MNYLKLKQKIYEAIERNPLDRSAYEEMFAVCREYEKIDFQTAHAWNHELRNRISWGLRMTVCSQKFDEAREFDDLMFRSLLFGAQHFFDDYLQAVEYGKPLDKKFYQPRRHYLRRYVDAYQEIFDGKLDFLSISMPKRAGKSQLGINFTNMLSGKYPDRATLMEGTGDDLVKSFYLGCLEYLTLPSDYHFYDIFPESKLVQTNADTKIINLLHKSRFPTVMCRSIDARQVGLSEATNLLYLDDCVEGREEAKNRQRLDDNSLTDRITEQGNEVNSYREQLQTYFGFSEDGLEIGKKVNGEKQQYSINIDNERMGFLQDGSEVAFIQYNKLHINAVESQQSTRKPIPQNG